MKNDEIWVDIEGYEGLYQISNKIRIRSLPRTIFSTKGKSVTIPGKVLTPTDRGDGYLVVGLRNRGNDKTFLVHRLLAAAFIPNPENKPEVNHKDADKGNHSIENLEWVTRKENIQHASKMGLVGGKSCPGSTNPFSKLNEEQVARIKERLAAGEKITEIAKDYKVAPSTIGKIKHGISWKHVLYP